jgi:FlaA1/EpsC-like NDP-sugar epimerase
MFSRQRRKARAVFGLGDVVFTAVAFELAYQIRVYLPFELEFFIIPPVKALVLGFSILAWLIAGFWLAIYDRIDPRDPRIVLRDVFWQSAYAGIAVVLFEYSLRLDLSRVFLGLFLAFSFVFVLLFRLIAGRAQLAEPSHALVVGCGERGRRLGATLDRSAQDDVRLQGFLAVDEDCPESIQLKRRYPVFPLSELPRLLRTRVIDEVFFAVESQRLGEMEDVFLACDEEGVQTRVAVDFFPHVNSDIYLERLGYTPLLTFAAAPHDEVRLMCKRLIDIVIAAAGLIALAPAMSSSPRAAP